MSWNGAGIFQRTNGTYTGSTVWNDDANAGWDIVTTRHDSHDQDLAQGINNCLAKDGQNTPTANLPMNNFRHTGVSEGQARNQYAAISQLQDQQVSYATLVSGTNTITATLTPSITAYSTGARYCFKAVAANTGAVTVAFNGISPAVAVQRYGVALSGGEIQANDMVVLIYDGTVMQLQSSTRPPLFVDRTNQRVGIGTTAPSTLLDVQGTVANSTQSQFSADGLGPRIILGKSRGASVGTNTIVQNGDTLGSIGFVGANGTGYDYAALIAVEVDGAPSASGDMPGRIRFYTTPDGSSTVQERMRIDNAGRLYLGTTASVGTGNTIQYLRGISSGTTWQFGPELSTGNIFYVINSSDTGVKLTSGATSWAANSDRRLKKNIKPIEQGLDNILALEPVQFDYLNEPTNDSSRVGFIAQDVLDHIPQAVSGSEEDSYSLSMTEIIPALVKSVQELAARVGALEAA